MRVLGNGVGRWRVVLGHAPRMRHDIVQSNVLVHVVHDVGRGPVGLEVAIVVTARLGMALATVPAIQARWLRGLAFGVGTHVLCPLVLAIELFRLTGRFVRSVGRSRHVLVIGQRSFPTVLVVVLIGTAIRVVSRVIVRGIGVWAQVLVRVPEALLQFFVQFVTILYLIGFENICCSIGRLMILDGVHRIGHTGSAVSASWIDVDGTGRHFHSRQSESQVSKGILIFHLRPILGMI